jgi:uncharacterized membrane protein YgcG
MAQVNDTANFFSPGAVQQANAALERMNKELDKELLIETFPTIPEEMRAQYDPARKDQFFDRWLRARREKLKADGIHVLITREPGYVRVGTGPKTEQENAFTAANREQLTSLMLGHLKNRDYDPALSEAVSYTQKTLQSNLSQRRSGAGQPVYQSNRPAPGNTPSGGGGGISWIIWVLIIGAGLFFLMRMLRNRAAQSAAGYGGYGPGGPGYGNPNYPQGAGYPPQQGGGFGRGMMGGVLGGLGGAWLGSKIFGHGNQAHGAPPPDTGSAGPGPLSDDQGMTGGTSGGSFDSGGGGVEYDSGGGDFGGGDSSGGEF